jgi:hypothetical protein
LYTFINQFNFKKTALDVFIDVQNLLGFKQDAPPNYTFKRNGDNTAFATTDGKPSLLDGSNSIPLILPNSSATVTPTIGVIFEF